MPLFTVICVLLLLASKALPQTSDRFHVGGYYKSFSVAYDLPRFETDLPITQPGILGQVNNTLRLDSRLRTTDWLSLHAAYVVAPRVQDALLFGQNPFAIRINTLDYRFDDLDSRLYPDDESDIRSFAVYQNLDRAFTQVELPWADVIIGRQAIAWGSARIVNPTDVLAPYAFTELDVENRIGVDAVRARIPVGMLSEVDLGYVAGRDFEYDQSALFGRLRLYVAQTDATLMLARFQENTLAGLDLARAIGGAGTWLEAAMVFVDGPASDSDEDYVRLSAGADYGFGNIYAFAEYHFNQAGSDKPEDYLALFNTVPYREGGVYLLGRHYANAGAIWQIRPLWTATGTVLFNVTDPSALLAPYLEYNFAENVYLAGGAYVGLGENPSFSVADIFTGPLSFGSEFGFYADTYYLSFRVYY